jgi:hypothetical protein
MYGKPMETKKRHLELFLLQMCVLNNLHWSLFDIVLKFASLMECFFFVDRIMSELNKPKPTTRKVVRCPVFGAPADIKQSMLPTNADVTMCYNMIQHKI